jgi:hypothetical protein
MQVVQCIEQSRHEQQPMNNCRRLLILFTLAVLPVWAHGQRARVSASNEAASPEMERLAKVFVGDWNTTESMERSKYFPNGGGRSGTSHWRLAVGGTTLVGEGHSDGSAGPLRYLITIWWDNKSQLYYFFTCFKDTGSSCRIRGTAHWEGDNFVNDYEEIEHGKNTKWRDSFVQITPSSHTLIAARDNGDGTMKTLITSRSTRR